MPTLRFDPWEPDYGSSDQQDSGALAKPTVDPTVEIGTWKALRPPQGDRVEVSFVDGVRRAEMRLVVEEGDVVAPGLLGTLAVGAVRCGEASVVEEPLIRRLFVVGGGVSANRIEATVGGMTLTYEPFSTPSTDPLQVMNNLQQNMLTSEGELAQEVARAGCIVIRDGPLTFYQGDGHSAVIGMVKRHVTTIFDASTMKTVHEMNVGERSPIFAFGNQALDRYAWYVRIGASAALEQALAGVVRCEVRSNLGLQRAVELADLTTRTLPRYASDAAHDPRAPKNLYPIGALERQLRHRMGDERLVRRALIEYLHATGGLN